MGGTDDPSNLIELTIEEHAEAHRLLWEKHGTKEDWLAWKGLSGLISKKEILKELYTPDVWSDINFRKKHKEATLLAMKRPEVINKIKNIVRSKDHQNKLNNRFTKEYISNVTNSISRDWKITNPNGKVEIVHNLAEYCRVNNLSRSGMSMLAKKNKPYKGYSCVKLG